MSTGNGRVRAAVPDISATGMILATREEVIAGEVTGSDGTRWRPTDREWADRGRLAGAGRPAHVAGSVSIPGGQLLMIDYSSTWVPGHRDHQAIRARARHILPV